MAFNSFRLAFGQAYIGSVIAELDSNLGLLVRFFSLSLETSKLLMGGEEIAFELAGDREEAILLIEVLAPRVLAIELAVEIVNGAELDDSRGHDEDGADFFFGGGLHIGGKEGGFLDECIGIQEFSSIEVSRPEAVLAGILGDFAFAGESFRAGAVLSVSSVGGEFGKGNHGNTI